MPLEFRVLIASSDVDVLDMFSRRLVALGCRPVAVTRPNQALGAVVTRHFHLALITPELDGGCGLQLVAELGGRLPGLPTLLLVGSPGDLSRYDVTSSGALRCVTCPRGATAVDAFLEDAIETACSAPRIAKVPAVRSLPFG